MALYTSFWENLLRQFNSELDANQPLEKTFSESGLEELGSRKSYSGYLEVFGCDVRSHSGGQVFRDLAEVVKKNGHIKTKLTGLLKVEVKTNNNITFNYQPFSYALMMTRYQHYQEQSQMKDELYKWKLVQDFQSLWVDYESGNLSFKAFIEKVEWKNLVYHMFVSNFKHLVEQRPAQVESALQDLYNLELSLQQRVEDFRDRLHRLHEDVKRKPTDQLFLAEREIATLLTFRYPERYTFFIPSFYNPLAKALGRSTPDKWHQLVDYYEIVDQFKREVLPKHPDVISLKNKLVEDRELYFDKEHLILIQDIFYVTLMKQDLPGPDQSMDESQPYQQFLNSLSGQSLEDLIDYFQVMDDIVAEHSLEINDKRIVFSCAQGRLNFITGQRYAWSIYTSGSERFRIISSEPLKENSENYKGKGPTSYFTRMSDIGLLEKASSSIHSAIEAELQRTDVSGFQEHENETFRKAVFDKNYRQQLFNEQFGTSVPMENQTNLPLNRILYGPPGTGKTYHTIDIAVKLADPKRYSADNHAENQKVFEELIQSGQVVFTTFHQSISYEDFIEGIKPKSDAGEITYEVEDGIFKKLSQRARSAFIDENNFDKAYQSLLKEIEDNGGSLVLETTVHSREFTIYENSKGNIKFHANTEKAYEAVIKKEVVEHYLLTGETLDWPSYTRSIGQHLKEAHNYKEQKQKSASDFVLIIDEINRGNVSQIFGELISLIEIDKREGQKNTLSVELPYSRNKFSIPSNLHLIGTMNTADRSVEALDTALRRRFTFEEMMPDPSLIERELGEKNEWNGFKISNVLRTINKRIEVLVDRDHLIGHAYFLSLAEAVNFENELRSIFTDKIIPLLQEYFYNNYVKIGMVLGSGFVSVEHAQDEDFAEIEDSLAADYSDRKLYRIIPAKEVNLEEALAKLMKTKGHGTIQE